MTNSVVELNDWRRAESGGGLLGKNGKRQEMGDGDGLEEWRCRRWTRYGSDGFLRAVEVFSFCGGRGEWGSRGWKGRGGRRSTVGNLGNWAAGANGQARQQSRFGGWVELGPEGNKDGLRCA
ncbi:unnamed protein product [Calypogeia fissa]